MGVLLTPTGASMARVETGGADRAEPDRPQGLDRAELEVARGEFSHPPSQFTGTRKQCEHENLHRENHLVRVAEWEPLVQR